MILPGSPILYLIVVVGVFVYFAFKGGGRKKETSPTKMRNGEEFKDWYMKLCEQNRKRNEERLEEIRYQKWLVSHQPE